MKTLCSWSVDSNRWGSGHEVPINLDKTIVIFVHTSLSPHGRQISGTLPSPKRGDFITHKLYLNKPVIKKNIP